MSGAFFFEHHGQKLTSRNRLPNNDAEWYLPYSACYAGLDVIFLLNGRVVGIGEYQLLKAHAVNTFTSSNAYVNNSSSGMEQKMERVARASIALSKLAPELTSIASTLASGARQQASQSREIAENVDNMANALSSAMETLNLSSSSVSDIVAAIKRVADQTRILSINASIEAARAGQIGLAFGAVAKEVESLAGQTSSATAQISNKVDSIRCNIKTAVEAAGLGEARTGEAKGFSIARLGGEMNEMASIAVQTAQAAQSVDGTSENIRRLCEELLLEVGTFRMPAHEHAVSVFRQLCGMREFALGSRAECEGAMRRAVKTMRIFELLYLTDAHGRQVSSNVWSDGRVDSSVYGSDWSSRTWFRSVMQSGEISVSDIYRSSASDSFCFTLSGPIFDYEGNFKGVLAADVNFADLLSL